MEYSQNTTVLTNSFMYKHNRFRCSFIRQLKLTQTHSFCNRNIPSWITNHTRKFAQEQELSLRKAPLRPQRRFPKQILRRKRDKRSSVCVLSVIYCRRFNSHLRRIECFRAGSACVRVYVELKAPDEHLLLRCGIGLYFQ